MDGFQVMLQIEKAKTSVRPARKETKQVGFNDPPDRCRKACFHRQRAVPGTMW
jgi:hypothetical protein